MKQALQPQEAVQIDQIDLISIKLFTLSRHPIDANEGGISSAGGEVLRAAALVEDMQHRTLVV
jgi:hypothetical protein